VTVASHAVVTELGTTQYVAFGGCWFVLPWIAM
jgi:hypothetical protein